MPLLPKFTVRDSVDTVRETMREIGIERYQYLWIKFVTQRELPSIRLMIYIK